MKRSIYPNTTNTKTKVVEKQPCPKCRLEGRDNSGDNLNVYNDGHAHCFACGHHVQPVVYESPYIPTTYGIHKDISYGIHKDIQDIYKNTLRLPKVYSTDDIDGIDSISTISNTQESIQDNRMNKINTDHIDGTVYTYEYLPWRGVAADTFRFFDVKSKIGFDGKPLEIGFPYPNGSVKVRSLAAKNFYTRGDIAKAGLFGRNKFAAGSAKTLIITEGELDAISIYQVLRSPVVSIHSAATARTDVGIDRSWCNSFEKIVLAFDADEAGRDAAREVASMFDYNKVYSVSFSGGDRKDANDYVRHDERDQLYSIVNNARRYLPETIVSSFADFQKILSEKPREGIPYPFPTWTYMTYGIRTSESVLLTAQEGVGKTEVMRAIEYQLLRETNDPIGVIFLEEPKQRHLQSLAGLHLKCPAHLPDSGVSDSDLARAVQECVGVDDRLHLYSHFGSDDPDSILDVIRFMVAGRGCRYVLLDHLTIVVSGLGGENERQALDYLSTRLEMMVKELDFCLIVVSHVNDDGKTRGSRNISKIADIRIDLSRELTSPDPTVRRTIHSVISKNRYCGRTGPSGNIIFDPLTNTLGEDYGQITKAANDNSVRNTARVA